MKSITIVKCADQKDLASQLGRFQNSPTINVDSWNFIYREGEGELKGYWNNWYELVIVHTDVERPRIPDEKVSIPPLGR